MRLTWPLMFLLTLCLNASSAAALDPPGPSSLDTSTGRADLPVPPVAKRIPKAITKHRDQASDDAFMLGELGLRE